MRMHCCIFLLFTSLYVYAYQEKPMVVVVPSYNNAEWYHQNLDSICSQNYNNYRVIYIDDASSDGTSELVRVYIDEHGLQDRVNLICNEANKGAMANHYKAAWMCDDHEIIVHLDGDDWFDNPEVLSRVNQTYQDPNCWLTYGQFKRFPNDRMGYCRTVPPAVIERNAFRQYYWITSHLRTFYAGLFKQIKLCDFMYDGNFFSVACDIAMMMPLLELAGTHIRFIPDVLYIYNEATPLNDYKNNLNYQLHCDRVVRNRQKYQPAQHYITQRTTFEKSKI